MLGLPPAVPGQAEDTFLWCCSCCSPRAPEHSGLVAVVPRLCCSKACGIFLDQGSNPCPLHWQAILIHWATRESWDSF